MDINELREKAFNFVRINGPILPVHISKFLESDILIASAILSDLVSQKKVFVTSVKYGGSPFYYTSGQEFKLISLSNHLKGKQKEIYDLIYQKKVLRDKILEPWQRVAIREIKDFAKMLRVVYQDQEEIFWKWYRLPDEQAKELIRGFFVETESKKEEFIKEKIEGIIEENKTRIPIDVQKKLDDEVKKKVVRQDSEFYRSVINYFDNKNIKIIDKKTIRKNKEFDFIAEIPSSVGDLRFYIKAKDKKKINDADLSLAYGEGKSQNMNVFFISNGELTKKAKELIEKKFKSSLLFKKLD
jgi:hypothetical protein